MVEKLEDSIKRRESVGLRLTHIFAPLGFDAGGQVFKLRQQPGSGPPAMQVVPVGHYSEFQFLFILNIVNS